MRRLKGLQDELRNVVEAFLDRAMVKTAQESARHSTSVFTFGVYPHARLADIASTVERLPDPFTYDRPEAALKSGTQDSQVSGRDST